MFNLINFFFLFFFLSIIISINYVNNFFLLIIFSEIIWIILGFFSISTSLFIDELSAFSILFFILSFATMELSLGFMLISLFKRFNSLSSQELKLNNNNGLNSLFKHNLTNKSFLF